MLAVIDRSNAEFDPSDACIDASPILPSVKRGRLFSDLSDPARGALGHRLSGAAGRNRAGDPAAARRASRSPSCRACRRCELPPEVVLLLVLPPLIYSAAVAMSWREFSQNLRSITLLAVGCVIFTAFAVAAATHYLIGLRWDVGFLLGAIVAPPDAVAPLAIARKLGIPRRVLVVLEGEGLANDATALILYRFAVVAITTGHFLAVESHRHVRRRRHRRDAVRRRGRLAHPARPPLCAGSAGRDHAVADHALHRLLGARTSRRLRRDRHRRLRPLCELERRRCGFPLRRACRASSSGTW